MQDILAILFQYILKKMFGVIITKFFLYVKKMSLGEINLPKFTPELSVKSGISIQFCLREGLFINTMCTVSQKAGTQQVVNLTECWAFNTW